MTVPPDAITAAKAAVASKLFDIGVWAPEDADAIFAKAAVEAVRHHLIDGDPSVLESRFRVILDDEEAAGCALIVGELLGGTPWGGQS